MEKLIADTSQLAVEQQKPKLEPKLGYKPLAAKLPKNESGDKVLLETNIRPVEMEKNRPIYKYHASVILTYANREGKNVDIPISISTKAGAQKEDHKEKCFRAYQQAVAKSTQLRESNKIFYDRQASVYTLSKLKLDQDLEVKLGESFTKAPNFRGGTFTLKAVAETFQATSNDIERSVNSCPALADKQLLEALNAMITGEVHANVMSFTVGNCVHYVKQPNELERKQFSAGQLMSSTGISKSVKVLEGTGKKPGLFLVTEKKETLFHPDNTSLLDIFRSYEESGRRGQQFHARLLANSSFAIKLLESCRRMQVYLDYGPNKGLGNERLVVTILDFGPPADACFFEHDGERTSVAKYFKKRYNITLTYPGLFTVVAKDKRRKMNLPPELLVTCNNQAVTTSQMVNNEQKDMTRMAAAPPDVRQEKTAKAAKLVGLASENSVKFSMCGEAIQIGQPLKVEGRQLVGTSMKKETTGHFNVPRKLDNWALCFVENDVVSNFKESLVKNMKNCGMTVSEPQILSFNPVHLENFFQDAVAKNMKFLFFVVKTQYHIHKKIKVFEQKYDICTQEVRYEIADRVKIQTLQNVVNKINMKLGGLNYLVINKHYVQTQMVIGFETTSEGNGGDGPVSIGFAANMMWHKQMFAGAYIYVKRSKDLYGPILKDTLIKIFATAKKNNQNNNQEKSELIIYFNGVTEGQYSMMNEEYGLTVKEALLEFYGAGHKVKFTLVAVSKRHNERLFLNKQGKLSNIQPGTVVDHTITNKAVSEFYLASAMARQGTAKPAKYTVITNTQKGLTMEKLENLTNALCHNHQIINTPISLPVPLYVAGRYSQRGATILGEVGPVITDGDIDYGSTNKKLGYGDNKLFGVRFNA